MAGLDLLATAIPSISAFLGGLEHIESLSRPEELEDMLGEGGSSCT